MELIKPEKFGILGIFLNSVTCFFSFFFEACVVEFRKFEKFGTHWRFKFGGV
jgi:hypothetical protein